MDEDYPEIEKIIIDVSRYLTSIKLDDRTLKMNPFRGEYLKGHEDCLNNIRNRIRDLIKKNGTGKKEMYKEMITENENSAGHFDIDNMEKCQYFGISMLSQLIENMKNKNIIIHEVHHGTVTDLAYEKQYDTGFRILKIKYRSNEK